MARTKEEFTKTPWTTNQSYARDIIRQRQEFSINPFNKPRLATERLEKEEELFLYNVNTREELNLKLIPDQLAESYSPKIVSVTPFGVITPINFYVGGDEKTISFAFKIYEDFNNVGGSVYNVIKMLENMAKPVYANARLLEPIVYFQLGRQFVGMGHISTTFTYNKPFRNGRYTAIDVSMTFTFHEQFDDDPIVLNDTYTSDMSPFALDSAIADSNEFIDDFILFMGDPDYFITQVFGNQKFKTYFNTVVTSASEYMTTRNRSLDEMELEEFTKSLQSSIINPLLDGQEVEANLFFSNPFALSLIDLFFNLREVMFTARSVSISRFIEYFQNLKRAVVELREEYETSYRRAVMAAPNDEIGWYLRRIEGTVGPGATTAEWTQMSSVEREAFEDLLTFYESIIDSQIALYESLRGAGS